MTKCTEVRLHNFPFFKFNISVAIDKFIPTLNIKVSLHSRFIENDDEKHSMKKWNAAGRSCLVSGNLTTEYTKPTFLN